MSKKRWMSAVLGLGFVAALWQGASALAYIPRVELMCPDVYAPVLCADGYVYSNGCWASIAGQTSCVPWYDQGELF